MAYANIITEVLGPIMGIREFGHKRTIWYLTKLKWERKSKRWYPQKSFSIVYNATVCYGNALFKHCGFNLAIFWRPSAEWLLKMGRERPRKKLSGVAGWVGRRRAHGDPPGWYFPPYCNLREYALRTPYGRFAIPLQTAFHSHVTSIF